MCAVLRLILIFLSERKREKFLYYYSIYRHKIGRISEERSGFSLLLSILFAALFYICLFVYSISILSIWTRSLKVDSQNVHSRNSRSSVRKRIVCPKWRKFAADEEKIKFKGEDLEKMRHNTFIMRYIQKRSYIQCTYDGSCRPLWM